jgi:site-specific DNA recombinase
MFATAHLLSLRFAVRSEVECAVRSLAKEIRFKADGIVLDLYPQAIGIEATDLLRCTIPLPHRKPFRETRLRIDAVYTSASPQIDLIALLGEAMAALKLVQANPEFNLNQLAKREGRCRTQLARLLRLSFLSPRIVDAIADGSQPKGLTRRVLLSCDVPIDWSDQERQYGLAA